MLILDFSKYSKLFAYGDIHGEFKQFFNNIKNNVSNIVESQDEKKLCSTFATLKKVRRNKPTNILNDSVIIVAGDISLGFNKIAYYEIELSKLNEIASKNNIQIIFVRGNHDDPSFFTESKFNFSNIHTVNDYTVIITEKHKTLCVGGGISIDRSWRKDREKIINKYSVNTTKKIYWENEPMYYDELKLKEFKDNNIDIDSVITHIPPQIDGIWNKDKQVLNWSETDSELLNDIDNEKNNIINLHNYLMSNFKISFWASGHLHVNNQRLNNEVLYIQMSNDYSYKNIDELIDYAKHPKTTISSLPLSELTFGGKISYYESPLEINEEVEEDEEDINDNNEEVDLDEALYTINDVLGNITTQRI